MNACGYSLLEALRAAVIDAVGYEESFVGNKIQKRMAETKFVAPGVYVDHLKQAPV